jgi:TIR domain
VAQTPIFVSYSQPDRETAYALVARLEQAGLRCWVAPRDVTPAADWAAEIIDAIATARVMVLVFSAHANASPQVRREVERAVHRDVTVLPFRVADVLPARSLEYFLSSQHWLDAFPPPMAPHYARLVAYLQKLLGKQAAPTAAAPPPAAPSPPARAAPDAQLLAHLERQLANYIGPLARHLVKRAAEAAQSDDALIEQLAKEIDSPAERTAFIAACRRSLRPR